MPTFHNLRLLFSGALSDPDARERNRAWSEKLTNLLEMHDAGMGVEVKGEEKMRELESWRNWEGAEEAHPRGGEEHFWPLVVCAAAAEGRKAGWWEDEMGGMGEQRSYFWV